MGSATPDRSKNHAACAWDALLGFRHDDSESPFRTLIEQALPDALFVHDAEGRFMEVNARACESVGFTRAELLNLGVFDIEQDFDLAGARAQWRTMQPGVRKVIVGTHRRRDGSRFPVEVHFGLLEASGQRCYLCIACDISERVQAQKALLEREAQLVRAREAAEAAHAAKSAFLASLAREFQVPLQSIVHQSRRLRLGGNAGSGQEESLRALNDASRRLEQLVHSMLGLSRLKPGD